MIVYVNIYPSLSLGRGELVTRTFTDLEQAAYQRYEGCLGTWEINVQTKEAKEIVLGPFNLET